MRWLLVVATACSSTPTYTLTETRSLAASHPISGIDSDGAGGLWIVSRAPTTDYYQLADVTVDHLDASGAQLSHWLYQDDYVDVAGLAFSGDRVWISYSGDEKKNYLRGLDPATGATVQTFATKTGFADAAWRPGSLLLSWEWNEIVALDPTTGGEQWDAHVAFGDGGTTRGLAADGDRTWIVSWDESSIWLVDDRGSLVATAPCPLLPDYQPTGMYLAWDGASLVMTSHDVIHWYSVEGGS
jgi:hypothetical protein